MTPARLLALLALVVAAGTGIASAHAELSSSDPAARTTVSEPLGEVRLVFSEAVEMDFGLFKVYALDADEVDPSAENGWRRLDGLAGALVTEVLALRDDHDARADVGPTDGARRGDEVTLALRDDLDPGFYVVMWRVLSVDTHATQGFFVFEYAPGSGP